MSHDAHDTALDTAMGAAAEDLPPTRMDIGAGGGVPQSPLPQPGTDWLHQAGNVEVEPPSSFDFAVRSSPPRAEPLRPGNSSTRSFATRRTMLRATTAAGIVGIAVMGYLYISKDSFSVIDMLGSELVKLVPESAPVNRGPIAPIDPRLADPVALEFQQLETVSPSIDTESAAPASSLPVVTEIETLGVPSPGLPEVAAAPTSAPATAPAPVPQPMPTAVAAVVPAAAPGVTNEELMLRLQRLELLLAQLQAQATGQPPSVAKAATAAAPAVGTTTAPAVSSTPAPAPRPAPARMTKAAPPKPVQHAKAGTPSKPSISAAVPAPSPALGGQLVSVDMWNGEASVVISSGLPGDRRVRVLRPGDVVNGLALRSADPVTRSATFAAPGSQGLTLYVSQGG